MTSASQKVLEFLSEFTAPPAAVSDSTNSKTKGRSTLWNVS